MTDVNISLNATELQDYGSPLDKLNVPYAVCESIVALVAVIGNAMVIHVFRKEKRLRRRTNYYIVSLATADFLVGLLGIPFAILASVGLPTNLYACLVTVSLLVVLCTISIFCLVAVSVDRYWAILYPMGYSRTVRTKTAIVIISICWFAGTIVGFLPLLGWHRGQDIRVQCLFVEVMDYSYLVFLFFATIITPSILLLLFYTHIYIVILKQLRQIVTMNPAPGQRGSSIRASSGTMLRVLGAAQKREVKATQNLSIIVLFFIVCWMPLYTINCVQAFCKTCPVPPLVMYSCIILSHLNSAGNPLLYAYHLRDFRAALKNLICRVLGIKEKPVVNLFDANARPSLASSNYNYSYQRQQSWRSNCYGGAYLESPMSRHRIAIRNATSSCTAPCRIISKAVAQTVTNAEGEVTLNRREMWHIKEVSSAAEDASKEPSAAAPQENAEVNAGADADANTAASRNGSTSVASSGRVNNGYITDGANPNTVLDIHGDDDDVFLSDSPPISSLSRVLARSAALLPFAHTPENTANLSNSSPQLSKSLFLVESDAASDTSDVSTADFRIKIEPHIHIRMMSSPPPLAVSASTDFVNRENNNEREQIHSMSNRPPAGKNVSFCKHNSTSLSHIKHSTVHRKYSADHSHSCGG